MYHPAAGVRLDNKGVLRVQRTWGFYQSTTRDYNNVRRYNVRWHRDINAAINMLKLFTQLYHEGTVPEQFLRSTAKDQLHRPVALRYKYKLAKQRMRWWKSLFE